jgi:hypothetical protein
MPRENSSLFVGLCVACLANLAAAQEVNQPKQPKQPDSPTETKSAGSEKPAPKPEAAPKKPEAAPKEPEAPPKGPADGAAAVDPARKEIPEKMPSFRYEALLAKSPFALATAAPEPVASVENFATNLVLNGLSKSRGKGGQEFYTVFVRSRDLSQRFVLVGDKPSDEGISLVSVEDSGPTAETVVVLKKGTEVGRVKFDQAAMAAAPQQNRPPNASGPVRSATPPVAPKAPIPRPGMSTQSRATTSPTPSPAPPASTPPVSSMQDPKRRVRPIGSPENP